MSRWPQQLGSKGSQRWLQLVVNRSPELIDDKIKNRLGLSPHDVRWLSPLKVDEYAEYSDQAFLDRLDVSLDIFPLSDFWPRWGPHWDGLAKSDNGDLFIVEAKSHIGELETSSGAVDKSLAKISCALDMVRGYLRTSGEFDWTRHLYQYANRLAHLYLLRTLNHLPAYLVFVYFVNDKQMSGPSSVEEWEGAIGLVNALLGLKDGHALSKYILDVFIDVSELEASG